MCIRLFEELVTMLGVPSPGIARACMIAGMLCASFDVVEAQRPSGDAIPRELAAALIADGGGAPEFVVGSVPQMLADRIPELPGARVLGAVLTASSATIAMSLSLRADSVRTLVMQELPKRGWKSGPVNNAGGGFRPATQRSPSTYCADGRMLSFTLATPSYGTTLLKIIIRDGNFGCPTGGGPDRVQFVSMSSSSQIPTLVNPRDVLPTTPTCRPPGGGYGQLYSTALRVAMQPEQLFEYYAKQLTDSGYVPVSAGSPSREISRSFTKQVTVAGPPPDAGRAPPQTQHITLRLSASPTEPECRMMRMEATTSIDR